GPPAGSTEAGRLATFVVVERAFAHPGWTSARPYPTTRLRRSPLVPFPAPVLWRPSCPDASTNAVPLHPPGPRLPPSPPPCPHNRAAKPPPTTRVYTPSSPIPHRHAGGVDLGLRTHWAAAPPLPDGPPQVAEFDTFTDSLEALADWLKQHGVTTVALEATGVYWEPLFALLEKRGFEVILVAPTYTSGIKGRPKTDRLDCHWI